MDGQGGGDYEIGNGGGDTFVFDDGYGQLEIDERDYGSDPGNVLQLGPGITPAQINLVGNENDWKLALTTATEGDQVTLDDQLLNDAYGVQQIRFADGTIWDRSQLLKAATSGSSINTTLYGSAGDDTFDPKGYAHDIWGYGGNDAVLMDRGYGQVAVHDFDAACKLVFSEDVTPDQLWLAQSGNDLTVQILGTADSAKLEGWFGSPSNRLQDVQAASRAQLDSGMGQLAQAMASYQAAHAGFDPATATAMPNDVALQGAIASAWHH